jgi:predicted RNA binding protein YcfA (HicA-like mRNA interferase family)
LTCSPRDFQKFATARGWTHARTKGSHESWEKAGAKRVVVIDTKYRDLPDGIVSANLRTMGLTTQDLREFLGQATKKPKREEPSGEQG